MKLFKVWSSSFDRQLSQTCECARSELFVLTHISEPPCHGFKRILCSQLRGKVLLLHKVNENVKNTAKKNV